MNTQNMPAWCYILRLQDNCFYVGASEQVAYRISQHMKHDGGSKWCSLHKPIEICFLKKYNTLIEALASEKRKVISYMRRYGIRFVRGADAVNCQLKDCYRKTNLWWLPVEVRKDAAAGLLGKLD